MVVIVGITFFIIKKYSRITIQIIRFVSLGVSKCGTISQCLEHFDA